MTKLARERYKIRGVARAPVKKISKPLTRFLLRIVWPRIRHRRRIASRSIRRCCASLRDRYGHRRIRYGHRRIRYGNAVKISTWAVCSNSVKRHLGYIQQLSKKSTWAIPGNKSPLLPHCPASPGFRWLGRLCLLQFV